MSPIFSFFLKNRFFFLSLGAALTFLVSVILHKEIHAGSQMNPIDYEKVVEAWDQETPIQFSKSGLQNISDEGSTSYENSKIVVFFDFSDPRSEKILSLVQEGHLLQKDLIFKPLSPQSDCHQPNMTQEAHLSCELNMLSFCAKQSGQDHIKIIESILARVKDHNRLKIHDQGSLTQILLQDLGLKPSQFENCKSSQYLNRISRVIASEGREAGIKSLPALFILNRPIDIGLKPVYLQSLYDSFLSQEDTRF